MAVTFTSQLQSEYQRLFDSCQIKPEKSDDAEKRLGVIVQGKNRYAAIEMSLGIPWFFTGIVHSMEGDCNFKTHLHNGDPLTAVTRHEPKNRPKNGTPPFEWEASAEDALIMKNLDTWNDWSIPGMLFQLERYNGFGYRRPAINIPSPYLWSFSNHYSKGKFVRDGEFSATAVSKQCGAAILLRQFFEKQIATTPVDRLAIVKALGEEVSFNPNRFAAKAEELQKLLNRQGEFLKVDGKAGRNTSDAFFRITGSLLKGDPKKQ